MADSTTPHKSSSEYSGSQAPGVQDSAQHEREHDYRAIPGGDPARATATYGMESVDQDANASVNAGHEPIPGRDGRA